MLQSLGCPILMEGRSRHDKTVHRIHRLVLLHTKIFPTGSFPKKYPNCFGLNWFSGFHPTLTKWRVFAARSLSNIAAVCWRGPGWENQALMTTNEWSEWMTMATGVSVPGLSLINAVQGPASMFFLKRTIEELPLICFEFDNSLMLTLHSQGCCWPVEVRS